VQFVPLTSELLAFRIREDDEAVPGWFEDRLADYLRMEPAGCFALLESGRPIGMITTVCYQQIAWLGWLYVSKGKRGHGLGEQLMLRAISYAEGRGAKTVVLEAVVEAVPLYRRLGFKDQLRTQHYLLTAAKAPAAPATDIRITDMRSFDRQSLLALDRRFFHEDRKTVYEAALANPRFRGFVAERDDGPVGYLGGTMSAIEIQAGPFVVNPAGDQDNQAAGSLVAAMGSGRGLPLHFRCPLVDPDRANALVELGAEPVPYHTVRMYRGAPYPLEVNGVLSLGCPGKG
jgi:GNAT superfamily N-acetyltransferase